MRTRRPPNPNRTFKRKDLLSNDGMLTAIWGPALWHVLHTMSFNYPTDPTPDQKRHYRDFVQTLPHVLPCRHCRENLKKTFKTRPLRLAHMKTRATFSRYIYDLHEIVNTLLKKKSNLSYADVRERYEHFRARCTKEIVEKGCTEPVYTGKKAKIVMKVVPHDTVCPTLQIDPQCLKRQC